MYSKLGDEELFLGRTKGVNRVENDGMLKISAENPDNYHSIV